MDSPTDFGSSPAGGDDIDDRPAISDEKTKEREEEMKTSEGYRWLPPVAFILFLGVVGSLSVVAWYAVRYRGAGAGVPRRRNDTLLLWDHYVGPSVVDAQSRP